MEAYKLTKFWWFTGFMGLGIIMAGSLMPSTPDMQVVPNFDKVLHFSGYAIATYYFQQLTKNRKLYRTLIFIFLYSALIEFLQDQLPTREMSFLDLVANGSGCLFGSLVSVKILPKFLLKLDNIFSNLLFR